MKKNKNYFIVVLFGLMSFMQLSCNKSISETKVQTKEEKIDSAAIEVKKAVKDFKDDGYKPEFFNEIECDSLYPNKKYIISINGNFEKVDENDLNSEFIFYQLKNNRKVEIYRDSVFIRFGGVEFKDFNNDNIKDILIQNESDVRSNLTYNLYLIDLGKDKLKKIKGFNEIKNPRFLSKYNLIDNYVMSGREWTSFYQIEGDSVKDFGYVIYQGEDENGNPYNYEDVYKRTLNKILKSKK